MLICIGDGIRDSLLNYCGKQHLLCFCDKMNNCMKKLIPGCTSYYARHSVASIAADGQWFSAPLYSDGRTPNIFLNWVEKLRGVEKPTRMETSLMERFGLTVSSWAARFSRTLRMKSAGEMPSMLRSLT